LLFLPWRYKNPTLFQHSDFDRVTGTAFARLAFDFTLSSIQTNLIAI
jgi:hypothetical protein